MPRPDLIANIIAPAPKAAKPARLQKGLMDIQAGKTGYVPQIHENPQGKVHKQPAPHADRPQRAEADHTAADPQQIETQDVKSSGNEAKADCKSAKNEHGSKDAASTDKADTTKDTHDDAATQTTLSLVAAQETAVLPSGDTLAVAATDGTDALLNSALPDQAAPAQTPASPLNIVLSAQAAVAAAVTAATPVASAETSTQISADTNIATDGVEPVNVNGQGAAAKPAPLLPQNIETTTIPQVAETASAHDENAVEETSTITPETNAADEQAKVHTLPEQASDQAKAVLAAKENHGTVKTDQGLHLGHQISKVDAPTTTPPQQLGLQVGQHQAAQQPAAAPVVDVQQAQLRAPMALERVPFEITAAAHKGEKEFTIRLDPADLGSIDVSVSVDKHGKVSTHLVVERSETLDQLRRDSQNLERALQNSGLKTDSNSLQFSLRDQNAQNFAQNRNDNQLTRRGVLEVGVQDMNGWVPPQYASLSQGRGSGIDMRI
ncbi:MAG: flagellar hook-length control protein FliK [Pseudomonadota bacterium]